MHTESILLGLEQAFEQEPVIPKTLGLIEKLGADKFSKQELLGDLLALMRVLGSYPVTDILESIIHLDQPQDQLDGILRFTDHFLFSPISGSFKTILKSFRLLDGESERVQKTSLAMLDDLIREPQGRPFSFLKSILLERDPFTAVKKVLDLYIYLYEDENHRFLRKSIEHYVSLKSDVQVFKFLYVKTGSRLIERIKNMRDDLPAIRLFEALSKSQVASKKWACRELKKSGVTHIDSALVLCGWYGVFAALLFEEYNYNIKKIRSLDIDPTCVEVADSLNQYQTNNNHQFKALCGDVFRWDYQSDENQYDLLVNTSCEHIAGFQDWFQKIPDGQLLLLQTNDFFECEEHVNCVNNLETFIDQAPLKETFFKGELKLDKYTRFMLIGRK